MGNGLVTMFPRAAAELINFFNLLILNLSRFSFSGFFSIPSWWLVARRWPAITFAVLDEIAWAFATALESVALISMLCFFFVCCGCHI
ncbi:hypothetical protein Cni_G27178 [Canna indica]|uniref:Uncharacterized protein n=1 Tax=Canna indica TaxID=4628 RepID=A0AAQ3L4G2_9LILI|nr:hypothetical protein Cni_G27178 [Canna indica]